MLLQLGACTDGILTGDDVQRLRAAALLACADSGNDGRRNARKNDQTYRSRNDLCRCDLINDFRSGRKNAGHIGDRVIDLLNVRDMNGISSVLRQTVNNGRINIGKHNTIACLCQQHTNKTASDIAGTELNGCFHKSLLL